MRSGFPKNCNNAGWRNSVIPHWEHFQTLLSANLDLSHQSLLWWYPQAALWEITTDAGLDFSDQPIPLIATDDNLFTVYSDERFIDWEFVAIYWWDFMTPYCGMDAYISIHEPIQTSEEFTRITCQSKVDQSLLRVIGLIKIKNRTISQWIFVRLTIEKLEIKCIRLLWPL